MLAATAMVAGYVGTFVEGALVLKCPFALAAIARRYRARCAPAIEPIGDRHFRFRSFRHSMARRPIGGRSRQSGEHLMTKLSKTLIATAAFAVIATSAFSEASWDFKAGMAYMYGGPGKMSAMAMAPAEKNHEAMMKSAKKVPDNTVFFMDNGSLYSTSGRLDQTGNFYVN
jgi:hypothetical protein